MKVTIEIYADSDGGVLAAVLDACRAAASAPAAVIPPVEDAVVVPPPPPVDGAGPSGRRAVGEGRGIGNERYVDAARPVRGEAFSVADSGCRVPDLGPGVVPERAGMDVRPRQADGREETESRPAQGRRAEGVAMTGIRVRPASDAPAPRRREEPWELKSAQKAMRLGGVLYLPHYQKPGVFVGPGQLPPEFKWSELEAQGAIPERAFLWPRGYQS